MLGLILSRTGRAGPGYWVWLFGGGVVFITAVHCGPTAVEPPHDIIDLHQPPLLGWLAFAELLRFLAVLVATFLYEIKLWRRQRRQPE